MLAQTSACNVFHIGFLIPSEHGDGTLEQIPLAKYGMERTLIKDFVTDLKSLGITVIFSFGGGDVGDGSMKSERMAAAARNHGKRKALCGNILSELEYFGADGVDLNWEFPGVDPDTFEPGTYLYRFEDGENNYDPNNIIKDYDALVKLMWDYFIVERGYVFTVTLNAMMPTYQILMHKFKTDLFHYVTKINVLAYGNPLFEMQNTADWELFTYSVNYILGDHVYFSEAFYGAPTLLTEFTNKIVIAKPLYAVDWPSKGTQYPVVRYYELDFYCNMYPLNPSFSIHDGVCNVYPLDPGNTVFGKLYWLTQDQLRERIEYMLNKGITGIAFWTAIMDYEIGHPDSILSVLNEY